MTESPSKHSADIAVIGAGIIGLSCAYELARQSDLKVVVFDKNLPGSGTTGGSAGVICLHNLGRLYVQLTLLGYQRIQDLKKHHGFSFQPWGELSVCYAPHPFPPQPDSYDQAFDEGPDGIYHRQILSREEILHRHPWIDPEGVLGGVIRPNQGYVDTHELLSLYERLAQETGRVEIIRNAPVLELRQEEGKIHTIVTRKGAWKIDQVLNAAGPWGAKVAALAGSSLALVPQRIQVCVATGFDDRVGNVPLVGVPEAVENEWVWCRGEVGGTLLFGQHHHIADLRFTVDPDHVNKVNDPSYPPAVESIFRKYWNLPRSKFLNGWCCVYGSTPDGFPIVSPDSKVENFYHAVGLNGHGMTCHAGVALCAAGMILRGESSLDLSPLLGRSETLDFSGMVANRFERGKPLSFAADATGWQ